MGCEPMKPDGQNGMGLSRAGENGPCRAFPGFRRGSFAVRADSLHGIRTNTLASIKSDLERDRVSPSRSERGKARR